MRAVPIIHKSGLTHGTLYLRGRPSRLSLARPPATIGATRPPDHPTTRISTTSFAGGREGASFLLRNALLKLARDVA